jgi:uncharacterized protein (DUF952 family)
MDFIFHITPRSRWQAAQTTGLYHADSLDTEGFIHCSRSHQLLWVADKFYRGQSDLVLLCIDPSQLQAELRDETIDTGAQFPHIYGALNVDAVMQVLDFTPTESGTFQMPSWPTD